jgi:serine/threonine-protein kinase RIO1
LCAVSSPDCVNVNNVLEVLEKKDECILNLVTYWEKTGLLHTNISKYNIIYSSQKPRKSL